MISDLGIWTIIINLIAIAFAVQYSRSETFGQALIWLVWDFTGLRFIASKVFPILKSSTTPPVTITLWVLGIYTALFGIASNRYENAVDKIEYRANAFTTQLAVIDNKARKVALAEVYEIQNLKCPVQPRMLSPSSIVLSLTTEDYYSEIWTLLTRTVEKYKFDLKGAELTGCRLENANFIGANLKSSNLRNAHLEGAGLRDARLEGARLEGAHFEKAVLYDADLRNANLLGTHFEGACLIRANIRDTLFWETSLEGADMSRARLDNAQFVGCSLRGVVLRGAFLRGADLTAAKDLTPEQLCSAESFTGILLKPELKAQVKQICPEKLEAPK